MKELKRSLLVLMGAALTGLGGLFCGRMGRASFTVNAMKPANTAMVVGALVCAFLVGLSFNAKSQSAIRMQPQKWEWMQAALQSSAKGIGVDGWELVAVTEDKNHNVMGYFKRPMQ